MHQPVHQEGRADHVAGRFEHEDEEEQDQDLGQEDDDRADAAGEIAANNAQVAYFPSYEIIAGSPTGGLYYGHDDREVNRLGVAHVMRLFQRHYLHGGSVPIASATTAETMTDDGVICDESLIERWRS